MQGKNNFVKKRYAGLFILAHEFIHGKWNIPILLNI